MDTYIRVCISSLWHIHHIENGDNQKRYNPHLSSKTSRSSQPFLLPSDNTMATVPAFASVLLPLLALLAVRASRLPEYYSHAAFNPASEMVVLIRRLGRLEIEHQQAASLLAAQPFTTAARAQWRAYLSKLRHAATIPLGMFFEANKSGAERIGSLIAVLLIEGPGNLQPTNSRHNMCHIKAIAVDTNFRHDWDVENLLLDKWGLAWMQHSDKCPGGAWTTVSSENRDDIKLFLRLGYNINAGLSGITHNEADEVMTLSSQLDTTVGFLSGPLK